jgi:hypothetical protein
MNKKEKAALAFEQQSSGIDYGNTIAQVVIKQFPNGFKNSIGHQVTAITDQALAVVIDKLATNGVGRCYRDPFKDGFYVGLRNAFAEYADDCAARSSRPA